MKKHFILLLLLLIFFILNSLEVYPIELKWKKYLPEPILSIGYSSDGKYIIVSRKDSTLFINPSNAQIEKSFHFSEYFNSSRVIKKQRDSIIIFNPMDNYIISKFKEDPIPLDSLGDTVNTYSSYDYIMVSEKDYLLRIFSYRKWVPGDDFPISINGWIDLIDINGNFVKRLIGGSNDSIGGTRMFRTFPTFFVRDKLTNNIFIAMETIDTSFEYFEYKVNFVEFNSDSLDAKVIFSIFPSPFRYGKLINTNKKRTFAYLWSSGMYHELFINDTNFNKRMYTFEEGLALKDICFTKDNKYLIFSIDSNMITREYALKLYDFRNKYNIITSSYPSALIFRNSKILFIDSTPFEEHFITYSSDSYLRLWNLDSQSSTEDKDNINEELISSLNITEVNKIKYILKNGTAIRLYLFNSLGQQIAVLDEGWKEAGENNYQLSIVNSQLPVGMYFVRLRAGDKVWTEKIIFLR